MAENEAIVMGIYGEIIGVKLYKNRFTISLSDDGANTKMIIEKDDFYKFVDKLQKLRDAECGT